MPCSPILGAADRWESVAHWANFTGKRTYFLERVQLAGNSPVFRDSLMKSIRRRKLDENTVKEFLLVRRATSNYLNEWRHSLTGNDIEVMRMVEEVTEIFKATRGRGYRTPHKA